jgi:hypothetical protein
MRIACFSGDRPDYGHHHYFQSDNLIRHHPNMHAAAMQPIERTRLLPDHADHIHYIQLRIRLHDALSVMLPTRDYLC